MAVNIFRSIKNIVFSESCFKSVCSLGELHMTELSCLVSVACRMCILGKYLQWTYGQISFFCKVELKAKVHVCNDYVGNYV